MSVQAACHRREGDVVAEGFEFGDEAFGRARGVAALEVSTAAASPPGELDTETTEPRRCGSLSSSRVRATTGEPPRHWERRKVNAVGPPIAYSPYDEETHREPHPLWRRMREEQPLYRNEELDFWALSRFEDVKACQVDWRRFSSARGVELRSLKSGTPKAPGDLVQEDPPIHTVHRQLLGRVFASRRIAAMEPQIRALCVSALDARRGTGELDFVRDLGDELPIRVTGLLLGIPDEFVERIRGYVRPALSDPTGTRSFLVGLSVGIHEYLRWRRRHPGGDCVTEIAHTPFTDAEGVTRLPVEEELSNLVVLLAVAGTETTTKLLGWAGHCLARHPEQRRLLVDDPSLIGNAIEEILRYEPPVAVQARCVTEDVELYGETVPAGSALLLLAASGNRDERIFDEPDRFDVRRVIGRHLAFGHGVHFCPGNALARLEARVAVEEVLKRFPTWELDEPGLAMSPFLLVRGWRRVPARI
jgi:cytochrome P450